MKVKIVNNPFFGDYQKYSLVNRLFGLELEVEKWVPGKAKMLVKIPKDIDISYIGMGAVTTLWIGAANCEIVKEKVMEKKETLFVKLVKNQYKEYTPFWKAEEQLKAYGKLPAVADGNFHYRIDLPDGVRVQVAPGDVRDAWYAPKWNCVIVKEKIVKDKSVKKIKYRYIGNESCWKGREYYCEGQDGNLMFLRDVLSGVPHNFSVSSVEKIEEKPVPGKKPIKKSLAAYRKNALDIASLEWKLKEAQQTFSRELEAFQKSHREKIDAIYNKLNAARKQQEELI